MSSFNKALLFLVALTPLSAIHGQGLVADATTLWLNQSSAVYFSESEQRTYLAWVSSGGSVYVGGYDHLQGRMLAPTLIHQWSTPDDHAAPSIHVIQTGLDRGKVVVACAHHNSTLFFRRSKFPEDITSWDELQVITTRKSTYPKLAETANGVLHVLFRGDALPPARGQSMAVLKSSTDAGRSWSSDTDIVNFGPNLITYPGSLRSFGNRLHILFNVPPLGGISQTVYHAWRDELGVWRAANNQRLSLPITASSMPPIFTGAANRNLVLGDLRLDSQGLPVIAFSLSPPYGSGVSTPCPTYRARFTGRFWQTRFVVTSAQVYYPAGVSIDPANVDRVLTVVRSQNAYELRSYDTLDGGISWRPTTLLRQTTPLTRPIFVENAALSPRLTWLDASSYMSYKTYLTNLRFGF